LRRCTCRTPWSFQCSKKISLHPFFLYEGLPFPPPKRVSIRERRQVNDRKPAGVWGLNQALQFDFTLPRNGKTVVTYGGWKSRILWMETEDHEKT
jgi:hypothetical protein